MTRFFPALLIAASASANSVTIDDYNVSATTGVTSTDTENDSELAEGYVSAGTFRQMGIGRWSVGTATLTTGGGLITSVSDVGSTVRLTYYFDPTRSMIPVGATIADSQLSLAISNSANDALSVSVLIYSNSNESSREWSFSVSDNSSGVFSTSLADISSGFAWTEVDVVLIEYQLASAGTVTLGIDGKGFAVTAPIPEPSTYGLMLGALALVGAAVRRRRSR